ncbi:MAG: hypothetical protein PHP01_02470 [Phycisphaerae bacterium]|nr:hypothetical protein [Phycisphaerae bacterium]
MKTQCPNCKAEFKVPEHYLGKKVKCLKCKNSFIIGLPKLEPEQTPVPVPLNNLPPIPAKQKDNFFVKLWHGSPIAFRTAFLATLGVISALAFAYYLMSAPKFLNKNASMQNTEASSNRYISSSGYKLAGCIVLLNYVSEFQVLANARANAAREFDLGDEVGLYGFLSVIKITESQLEDLYLKVHKLNMSDDMGLQSCYKSLLNAIDTEYAFQKSMLPIIQNPDDLQIRADFQELSKKAVENSTFATTSILTLLYSVDEGLYEKICYTWNAD